MAHEAWIAQLGAHLPDHHADAELWGLTRRDAEALAKKLDRVPGRRFLRFLRERWFEDVQATPAGLASLEKAEVQSSEELWEDDLVTRAVAEELASTLGDPQREVWLLEFLGFGAAAVTETAEQRALRLN